MGRPPFRMQGGAALLLATLLWGEAGPANAYDVRCPDCDDIPFSWDTAAPPPVAAPYPQGFALTVPVTPGVAAAPPARIERYADIATALGRCWSPLLSSADARWRDVTLRVSFKRDGSVNGLPRIVHVSDAANAEAGAQARTSLLGALGHCTPLALTSSLGQAIAGQIFAIRFVQQRNI